MVAEGRGWGREVTPRQAEGRWGRGVRGRGSRVECKSGEVAGAARMRVGDEGLCNIAPQKGMGITAPRTKHDADAVGTLLRQKGRLAPLRGPSQLNFTTNLSINSIPVLLLTPLDFSVPSLPSPAKDVVCHTESHSVCSVAKATESHAGWKHLLAAWQCLTQPLSPGQNRGSLYLSLVCEVMGGNKA